MGLGAAQISCILKLSVYCHGFAYYPGCIATTAIRCRIKHSFTKYFFSYLKNQYIRSSVENLSGVFDCKYLAAVVTLHKTIFKTRVPLLCQKEALCKKYPNADFFLVRIFAYPVRIRENTDPK